MIQPTYNDIQKVLVEQWDPIGVYGDIDAEGEYDSYVPKILKILEDGGDTQRIFEALWEFETIHMGLSGERGKTLLCADTIYRLKAEQ